MSGHAMVSFIKHSGNLQKIVLFTALCIAVVIAAATLTPWAGKLAPQGVDKLCHAAGFAVLVMHMLMVRLESGLVMAPLALGFCRAIERIQRYLNRFGNFSEFWQDLMSVLIGVTLAILFNQFIKECVRRKKNLQGSEGSF
jgi:hypothetical protein